jgi:hypothetical protein
MESIRNSMDPRAEEEREMKNMKKNMKIPRKKEKPEQPVIVYHKITSLI